MQDLICHADDFTNLHQALAGGALIAVIVTAFFMKNLARMRARIHRWRAATAASSA